MNSSKSIDNYSNNNINNDVMLELDQAENCIINILKLVEQTSIELQKQPNTCDYEKLQQLSSDYLNLVKRVQNIIKSNSNILLTNSNVNDNYMKYNKIDIFNNIKLNKEVVNYENEMDTSR